MDGIKKTALFLSGLEWKTVDLLLGRLDPEMAKAVRREMMSMKKVSAQETNRLADEFLRNAESVGLRRPEKFALNNTLDNNMSAERIGSATYSRPQRQTKPRFFENDFVAENEDKATRPIHVARPFEFLRTQDAKNIARELIDEHPQVIAAVLSHLPSLKARNVIERLPIEMRHDVKQRLAGFDSIDSELLHEIEQMLRDRLLCSPVKTGRHFEFEDLYQLGNAELSTLFHSVDLLTAMLSLVGAHSSFIERVTQRFSPTEQQRMRQQLKEYGPMSEDDVFRARKVILEKAEMLLRKA